MPPPPARRLVLLFGGLIAAVNLVIWTLVDYSTYGLLTTRGLVMGLFVLTAVLLLYVILRLAILITGEDTV